MKERSNNPLDDGWDHDDFVMDSGFDDASDVDLWQIESSPDAFGSPEYAPIGFDEPEPAGEFIRDLSQDLHPPDEGIHNLRQTLELDEFLAYVGEMTDCQRHSIEEALLRFSARRRANWLRWLKSKKWTGKTLLLFLRFHDLWNKTSEWWEYFHFSSAYGVWPNSNPNALSREGCYILVHLRSDHRPKKIIDKSWFEDWVDLKSWRYGFNSFASFAIFRAGLSPNEDWKRLVIESRSGYYTQELRRWRIYVEWWDDMSEWHDNLD